MNTFPALVGDKETKPARAIPGGWFTSMSQHHAGALYTLVWLRKKWCVQDHIVQSVGIGGLPGASDTSCCPHPSDVALLGRQGRGARNKNMMRSKRCGWPISDSAFSRNVAKVFTKCKLRVENGLGPRSRLTQMVNT